MKQSNEETRPSKNNLKIKQIPKAILQEISHRRNRARAGPVIQFKPIFHFEFLKKINPLETSIKVLTSWFAGDLFLGKKATCEAVALDADPLQRKTRVWGGGTSTQSSILMEGLVHLDFVEMHPLQVQETEELKTMFETDNEEDESLKRILYNWFFAWGFFWVLAWCLYVAVAFIFFAVAVGLSQEIPVQLLAEVPTWRYFLFLGLLFAIPFVMRFLLTLFVKLFRVYIEKLKPSHEPSELQGKLEIAFLVEQLNRETVLVFTFALYTISFLLIFAVYPVSNQAWVDAYRITTSTLGLITIYFVGRVLVQIATHWIAREVDVYALGQKVRKCLRAEQALWEILQVTPNSAEKKLFTQMENPFLLYDPKLATKLRKLVIKTQMMGRLLVKNRAFPFDDKWVYIRGDNPEKAGFLGSWMYQSLVKRSCEKDAKQLLKVAADRGSFKGSLDQVQSGEIPFTFVPPPVPTWRGFLKKQLRRFSVSETFQEPPQQEGSMSSLQSSTANPLSRHQQLLNPAKVSDSSSESILALDLAQRFNFRVMDIFPLALNSPASASGTLRGCPKIGILIEDVEACLDFPKETLDYVWNDFLDPEHRGRLSLKRAKTATIKLVNTRISMKAQLESNRKVKEKLASVIGTIMNFFVFFAALAIYGLDVMEVWVGISSILLAFTFVFGGTLKNIFDSVVFLFGVHSYDIGDKVKLGASETPYVVEAIALMSTTLKRWDGSSTQILNSKLYQMDIINVNRSGKFSIMLNMLIDCASLPDRRELESIQSELEDFLLRKSGYTGDCSISAREFIHPLQVRIATWFELAYSDLDSGRRNRDLSRVIQFLISAFKSRNFTVSGISSGKVDLCDGAVRW